jgi:6-phosphogluconolactonase (cycloisomerase 2 family)
MSNFTKTTNFTAKDSLLSGNPDKVVRGAEIDAEFDAIAVSIATKYQSGDALVAASGSTFGTLTLADGSITDSSGSISFGNENLTTTGTLAAGATTITGNITISGTVDGRDVATDGTKLDGIETGATADQSDAEIKTAYENNADTNAFTDSEKTKLGTIETGADVTDATNVDAAGAVMNSDASTASMSFVIDEDSFTSNLATKVPTQQSVKSYVDATVVAIGGLTIDEPVASGEFGVFTSGSTIGGQTPAEVRASLDLEVGTDVQAHDADLDAIAALTPTDGHFLQYTGGAWTSADVQTDPTLGTLTKTFVTNEDATITLSSAPSGQPVVSVTKDVPQVGVTNNQWSVGASNYTLPTESPATTLDFSYSGSGSHLSDPSKSYAPPSVTGEVRGVRFNNDGTKMFVLDDNDNEVWEYTLSTAYDVSTATEVDSISANSQEGNARGFCFNDNGKKLFVIGQSNDAVFEYSLSNGFNVSTGSYSGNSYSVNAQDTSPQDISFSSDGLKMFILGGTGRDINEYTLSVAFDITSTVTFIDSLRVDSSSVLGMSFSSDGLFVYLTYSNANVIGRYALSTAWDISTADYTGAINVASLNSTYDSVYGVCITDSDTKMVFGTNDSTTETVAQYDVLGPVLTKGTGSWSLDELGATITANSGTFKLLDLYGATEELTAPTGTTQVSSGNWDIEYLEYNSTDGDLQYITDSSGVVDLANLTTTGSTLYFRSQETSPQAIFMKPDGTKFYLGGTAGDDINEYSLSTPYDLSTASFVTTFSVSTQESSISGFCFSQDGSWLFVVGYTGDDINRYSLSTAWDISTASVSGSPFSVATQQTNPKNVAVNDDGSQIWVCSSGIHEYSMTNFGVSSASFVQTAAFGLVAWFEWNADGTELYVLTNDYILSRYTPSTAYDISTAGAAVSSTYVAGSDTGNAQKCALGNYGEYIYLMGDNWVDCQTTVRTPNQPAVVITTDSTDSTYWTDINSMTATEAGSGTIYYAISTDDRTTWSVVDDTNGERDIVRNNAGTWEYNSNATYGLETWTAGATNTETATLEEAMGTAQNQMDKTQLDAVTDPNHITLANDLDLAIIFYGHSDPLAGASSDGVSINYDANTLEQGAVLGTDYEWDYLATDKVRITALAGNNLKVRVV